MKLPFSLIVLFAVLALSSTKCKKKVKVDIEFTYTESYCGGAPPPDELLEMMSTPRAMEGVMIHLKRDGDKEKNSLHVILQENKIILPLKEGVYSVYLNTESQAKGKSLADSTNLELMECHQKWYSRAVAQFTVTDTSNQIKVNVHKECDPCIPPAP